MTRYNPAEHDSKVRLLSIHDLTPEAIASRLGVELRSVRNALIRMNLIRSPKHSRPTTAGEEPLRRSTDLNNPMSVAFLTFGPRLMEVNGSYRLDNTPIRFFDLMKRVNRVRKSKGQSQIGPEAWHA